MKRQRVDVTENNTIDQFAWMYIFISISVVYLTILN
jgi:hypothetical protein